MTSPCLECGEVCKIVARGVCHRCYQRLLWRKKNNPDTWEGWPYGRTIRTEQPPGCEFCNPQERVPVYAKGLCRPHYRRALRRKAVLTYEGATPDSRDRASIFTVGARERTNRPDDYAYKRVSPKAKAS